MPFRNHAAANLITSLVGGAQGRILPTVNIAGRAHDRCPLPLVRSRYAGVSFVFDQRYRIYTRSCIPAVLSVVMRGVKRLAHVGK